MRITLKSYKKACATVVAARDQLKVVKAWEGALRDLGDLGNQELVALTLKEDGSIQTECKLLTVRKEPESTPAIPQSSLNKLSAIDETNVD